MSEWLRDAAVEVADTFTYDVSNPGGNAHIIDVVHQTLLRNAAAEYGVKVPRGGGEATILGEPIGTIVPCAGGWIAGGVPGWFKTRAAAIEGLLVHRGIRP